MRRKVLLIIAMLLVVVMLASLTLGLILEIRQDDTYGSSGSSSSDEMNQPGSSGSGNQTDTDNQAGSNDQALIDGAYVVNTNFGEKYCTWEYMVQSYEFNLDSEIPYYSDYSEITELCAIGYDIIIPDDVTYVGCFDVNSIVFPKTTTKIGYVYTFCGSIFIRATTPPELVGGLQGEMMNAPPPIYVPIGCGEIYKAAEGWAAYADYIFESDMNFLESVDKEPEKKDYIWTVTTAEGTFDFDTRKNYANFNWNSYGNLYYSTLEEPDVYRTDDRDAVSKEDVAIAGSVIRFFHPYYLSGFVLGEIEPFSAEAFAFFYRFVDTYGNYSGYYSLIDGTNFDLSAKEHRTGHVQTDPKVDLNGIITNNGNSYGYYSVYLSGLGALWRRNDPLPSRMEIYLFCGTKR